MNRRSTWWSVISTVVGAAFVVAAITGAPGITYAIIAVIGGMAYSLVTRLTKPGPGRDRGRARRSPRG